MMSASNSRFTQADPGNQQPALWVLTSLFATWCFLGVVARAFIRRKTWLLADSVHVLACILGACSWIAMYVALDKGAGKSPMRIAADQYSSAGKAVFASTIFLVLAKAAATSSHLLLLHHMLAMPSYVRLCTRTIMLCVVVYIGICLTVSVGCSPKDTLSTKAEAPCHAGVARWSTAVTFAILQIAAAAGLPALAFSKIQKPLQTRLNIISWFSVPPLFDIVPLCLSLWEYTSSIDSAPSGTGLVGFLVCLHSSLCWNLLYPIIPALRPTALSYATRGAAITPEGSAMSYSGNMFTGSNNSKRHPSAKKLETDEMPLRPLHSREGNHTSIGAISNDDDLTQSSHGASNVNAIQVTQEYRVSNGDMQNT